MTEPLRRCIATGDTLPTRRMLRFVADPDGQVVFDREGRLPGRGMWIKADRAALERAIEKNLFSKAARQRLKVEGTLARDVESLLLKSCLDILGLGRRAGQVISGYEKVRAALKSGKVRLLLEAADAAAGGKTKMRAVAGEIPVETLLVREELGLAFGRENVVHAAFVGNGLAERFGWAVERLRGVRSRDPSK